MAAKSFGIDLTFDYIFNAAKDRGFTRQGEILFKLNSPVVSYDLHMLQLIYAL
jgi:hypothetical protein